MAEAYLIGAALGAGVGVGIAAAAFLRPTLAAIVGAIAAAVIGTFFYGYDVVVAGAVGGLIGGASGGVIVRGARRRGGTAGSTAALVLGFAVFTFVLALIPGVGYVEAVAAPLLAIRARRRAGKKYAGLRTLAE